MSTFAVDGVVMRTRVDRWRAGDILDRLADGAIDLEEALDLIDEAVMVTVLSIPQGAN